MKKQVKTALIVSGVAAATTSVLVGLTYLTSKMFVDAALDREMPKSMQKFKKAIAGFKKNEDFVQKMRSSADELKQKETEEIVIKGFDGITLVGHVYPAENAKRVIVAMHGWRSSWSRDFGMIADFWHDNGCTVIYAEQRAQHNSQGEYISFGLSERFDCLSWINLASSEFPELPIYLAGISMGATTVLMASGFGLSENVHGILADCGFTSPQAIWKHVSNKNLHLPYGIHGIVASSLFRKKLNMECDEYSTLDAMRTNKTPILFVHGTDDKFVPIKMTYDNYYACTAPKRLLVVPGANHGMSYSVETEKYEKTVLEFFEEFDGESKKH